MVNGKPHKIDFDWDGFFMKTWGCFIVSATITIWINMALQCLGSLIGNVSAFALSDGVQTGIGTVLFVAGCIFLHFPWR